MSIFDKHGKFNGRELEYVSLYLDSEGKNNKISWVQRFEEKVARKLGVQYAVACNSGTSGLHMAMVACGIGPGDEVITPGLTVVIDPVFIAVLTLDRDLPGPVFPIACAALRFGGGGGCNSLPPDRKEARRAAATCCA